MRFTAGSTLVLKTDADVHLNLLGAIRREEGYDATEGIPLAPRDEHEPTGYAVVLLSALFKLLIFNQRHNTSPPLQCIFDHIPTPGSPPTPPPRKRSRDQVDGDHIPEAERQKRRSKQRRSQRRMGAAVQAAENRAPDFTRGLAGQWNATCQRQPSFAQKLRARPSPPLRTAGSERRYQ